MAQRPKNVLVVENTESERRQLVGILTSMGYETYEAGTSDEALRAFKQYQPDLVIIEILIPGMGGLSVCKLIKEQAPDWAKVVVTSKLMQSRTMMDTAMRKNRADRFLQKPFEVGVLTKAVMDLIGISEVAPQPKEEPRRAQATSAPTTEDPVPASAPRAEPAVAEPRPREARAFERSGLFTSDTLPDLLAWVMESRLTGALQIEGEPGAKQAFFMDGSPVFVQSNIRDESLGRMLLESGLITEDAYRDIMAASAETGRKVGNIVVERGLLSPEDLTAQLCRQTALKLAQLFAWPAGRYRFDDKARYPENAATFEATPAEVFLLGLARFAPVEALEKLFARDRDAVPRPTSPSGAFANAADLLDDVHRTLLADIDGQSSLAKLTAQTSVPVTAFLRAFYALVALGAIGLSDAPTPTEKVAPSAVPRSVTVDEKEFAARINRVAARLEEMNHYELLGIEPDAKDAQIDEAFRKKREEFNPDQLGFDAPAQLVRRARAILNKLNEARTTLLDPEARRRYKRKTSRTMVVDENDPQAMARKKKMDAEVAFQKGLVAMERKRYPYAVECFDPDVAEYHARTGYALFKMLANQDEMWEDATNRLSQAIRMDAENVNHRMWLAEMLRFRGDDATAYKIYRKVLELAPNHDEAKRQAHYLGQQIEAKSRDADDAKKSSGGLFGRKK
ncbi:MAG: response regulator [Deltaproteobacteria bacterium]|nr:response regulator [Deltaproteobacteria bacterium]